MMLELFNFQNFVSWIFIALTMVLIGDDIDSGVAIRSINKDMQEDKKGKVRQRNMIFEASMSTRGHSENRIYKRYTIIGIIALAFLLVDMYILKFSFFGTWTTNIGVVVAIIIKHYNNKQYEKLKRGSQ